MSRARQSPIQPDLGAQVSELVQSFERHLWAENKAALTVRAYLADTRLLFQFLEAQGMPSAVEHIHREHVEAFIADDLQHNAASTARRRYRSLQQFFKWCVDEGEVKSSPLVNMKPPKEPETLPQVLTEDEIARLLKTCSGRTFIELRDTAVIRLLWDTGMRLGELESLTLDRLDFTINVATVVGKGSRERGCPFGRKTAQALDRYLRARGRHPLAADPHLWLGHRGVMNRSGLYQLVRKRGAQAGMPWLHPHLARHTAASEWLKAGGQEGDLRALMGWRSPTMIQRYARSTAAERARLAHQRLSLMDRL